jgi:hypothetical protein
MAISETILGPNSSLFTYGTGETPATVMTALDTYITSKGWTLYDAAAPQGQTVGRVYRALQDGSAVTYKYVGIAVSAATIQLKIWESWNSSTHVGTNDGTYYNPGGSVSLGGTAPTVTGTAGYGVVMFVNPKWLAFRAVSNTLVYSVINGAFEISKDYGEADSTLSNIFMTSTPSAYPINTSAGFYGSLRGVSNSNTTGVVASTYNSIVLPTGLPLQSLSLGSIISAYGTSIAATITAVELAVNISSSGVKLLRGRVFGAKIALTSASWNDMDTAQVLVDANYHESPSGTSVSHHIINPSGQTYARFLIPV